MINSCDMGASLAQLVEQAPIKTGCSPHTVLKDQILNWVLFGACLSLLAPHISCLSSAVPSK